MRSGFARVFISFWAAMALIVAGAIAVTLYALAERAEEMPRRPARIVNEAAAALEQGGRAGLQAWLRRRGGDDALQVFVIDESGRELLGRTLPRRLAHRLQHHDDGPERERSGRGRAGCRSGRLPYWKDLRVTATYSCSGRAAPACPDRSACRRRVWARCSWPSS